MANIERRLEALETTSQADERQVMVVRFIVAPKGSPEKPMDSAVAGGVELTRQADESEAQFLERAKSVAKSNRRPNCGAVVICGGVRAAP